MTTPSDRTAVTESVQDWPATAGEILAAIAARRKRWRTIGRYRGRTFSHYEVSDKGGARSVDRVINGRRLRGVQLKTQCTDDYERVKIRDDSGDVLTEYVHRLVVARFRPGGFPPGMQTRHGFAGPQVNAYPENLTSAPSSRTRPTNPGRPRHQSRRTRAATPQPAEATW